MCCRALGKYMVVCVIHDEAGIRRIGAVRKLDTTAERNVPIESNYFTLAVSSESSAGHLWITCATLHMLDRTTSAEVIYAPNAVTLWQRPAATTVTTITYVQLGVGSRQVALDGPGQRTAHLNKPPD